MDLKANAERFTGKEYIETYARFRPSPPMDIVHQSLNYLKVNQAKTIVDLGCGTGVSTGIWSDFAEQVIGLEPSYDMLTLARSQNDRNNITYLNGFSHDIKVANESVDIVACSQAFHWMEPNSTLKEINRILKKNGVFVLMDLVWPPSINFEYEQAYNHLFKEVEKLTSEINEVIAHKWDKKGHFQNIRNTAHFKFLKQVVFHKNVRFTKEKFIGIALSQGGLEALRKRGYTEEEIGLSKFKKEIESFEMPEFENMTYSYNVIFAIKKEV